MSKKVCVLTPIDGGKDLYNKIKDTCNKLINAGKDVEWNSYIVMHLTVPELLPFTFQQKLMHIELLSGIDTVYLMAGWEDVPTNKLVYKVAKQLGIEIVSLQEKYNNINASEVKPVACRKQSIDTEDIEIEDRTNKVTQQPFIPTQAVEYGSIF